MGASSGYLGDRYSALDEVMTVDAVDVIIGDPAEITLAGPSSRRTDIGWIEYAVQPLAHAPLAAVRPTSLATPKYSPPAASSTLVGEKASLRPLFDAAPASLDAR
jgi:hypothetical protein